MERTRYIVIFAITAGLSAAIGCTQPRPDQARAGEQIDPNAFLHEHLQKQSEVTVAEAYRAMVMLAEGQDKFHSFAGREEYLLSRRIVRPEWKLHPEFTIDRGTVAYMIMKILDIRGGVNWNVYGRLGIADRRYAVRELVYRNIMTGAPPYRSISGAEFVDVIANADAAMADRGAYTQEKVDVVEQVTSRPGEQ